MPKDEPEATSTPTSVPNIKGRKGIRDQNSIQSPIILESAVHSSNTRSYYESNFERSDERFSPKASPKYTREGSVRKRQKDSGEDQDNLIEYDQANSDSEYDDNSDFEPPKYQNPEKGDRCQLIMILLVIFIAMALAALYFSRGFEVSVEASRRDLNKIFNDLENKYPSQQKDFWQTIKVGIKEIPILEQPRTIIFLYEQKTENTLNKILYEVSSEALCDLSYCSNKEIVIEGSSLNTSEIISDYGKTIDLYRTSLKNSGVMIVKNLEKVPGLSAQAFHSICDDYNPVVKKALILFTMKVDKIPDSYLVKFLEDYLLDLWKDLGKDDKFYPLFTRISSTVLHVKPEKSY